LYDRWASWITGHLVIGNNVKIAAQSGISTNLSDNEVVMGSPSFDISTYKKAYIHFRNLPKIVDRIAVIEKELKAKP
jgi:UDP-3-O-[3-hydroxymyristoyl] glucosamine N-acyltransferase